MSDGGHKTLNLSETANRRSLDGIVLHAATGTPGNRRLKRLSGEGPERDRVNDGRMPGWENDPEASRRMENKNYAE